MNEISHQDSSIDINVEKIDFDRDITFGSHTGNSEN